VPVAVAAAGPSDTAGGAHVVVLHGTPGSSDRCPCNAPQHQGWRTTTVIAGIAHTPVESRFVIVIVIVRKHYGPVYTHQFHLFVPTEGIKYKEKKKREKS
jgi:hypothetical protein